MGRGGSAEPFWFGGRLAISPSMRVRVSPKSRLAQLIRPSQLVRHRPILFLNAGRDLSIGSLSLVLCLECARTALRDAQPLW